MHPTHSKATVELPRRRRHTENEPVHCALGLADEHFAQGAGLDEQAVIARQANHKVKSQVGVGLEDAARSLLVFARFETRTMCR